MRVQVLLGVGVAEADGASPPAGGLVVESVAFEDPRHSADGTCSVAVLLDWQGCVFVRCEFSSVRPDYLLSVVLLMMSHQTGAHFLAK
ncbi:hypothetical protein DQE82_30120 [Micromonospora sp. LHW51205]|nr:hypothetical protein DQE82_30120 [Micromonospora sp. LHW51205]